MSKKTNIDSIIAYILIQKLITPITKSKAYEMKLVNSSGRVVKEPENKKEEDALTLLDRSTFKLKRLIGSKIPELNAFIYLNSSPDLRNKIIVNGDIENRSEIKRLKKDIKTLQEDYQIPLEDMITILLQD